MNRAYGGRSLGPLPRGRHNDHACLAGLEPAAPLDAVLQDVTARPDDRWRAILPLGVLPDDGTTIGARSLCDLMDKLDALYSSGG